jgi:hypothetical protein
MDTRTGISLPMVGQDGNAFAILGRARRALRNGGYDQGFIERFIREATSDDYNHLLMTVMDYFEIDGEAEDSEYA